MLKFEIFWMTALQFPVPNVMISCSQCHNFLGYRVTSSCSQCCNFMDYRVTSSCSQCCNFLDCSVTSPCSQYNNLLFAMRWAAFHFSRFFIFKSTIEISHFLPNIRQKLMIWSVAPKCISCSQFPNFSDHVMSLFDYSVTSSLPQVATHGAEILSLPLLEFIDILESDELNVKNEEFTFDVIMRWVYFIPFL